MDLISPAFALSAYVLISAGVTPTGHGQTVAYSTPPEVVVQIDFNALDDASKRRLTYYASNILTNISEMARLERAGDTSDVQRTLAQTRQLASRLEDAATEYGLTRGEMLEFFLRTLTTELRGPIPRAILAADGQFRIASLFEDGTDTAGDGTASGGVGYINLLRDENIGGVDRSN